MINSYYPKDNFQSLFGAQWAEAKFSFDLFSRYFSEEIAYYPILNYYNYGKKYV